MEIEEAEFIKIIGKCRQCGKCCRDLILDVTFPRSFKYPYGNLVREDFNALIEEAIGTHLKKNPHLDFRKVHTVKITSNSIHISGVECLALKKKGNKFICSLHKNKPEICKDYPQPNSILRKGCGFKKRKIKNVRKKNNKS